MMQGAGRKPPYVSGRRPALVCTAQSHTATDHIQCLPSLVSRTTRRTGSVGQKPTRTRAVQPASIRLPIHEQLMPPKKPFARIDVVRQDHLTAHEFVRETLRGAILRGELEGRSRLVQADIAYCWT